MDVVRFSESDVIVASTTVLDTLQLSFYNDGTKGNARINEYSISDFINILDSVHTMTGDVYLKDAVAGSGEQIIVSKLGDYEESNPVALTDGSYIWNASTHTWNHQ